MPLQILMQAPDVFQSEDDIERWITSEQMLLFDSLQQCWTWVERSRDEHRLVGYLCPARHELALMVIDRENGVLQEYVSRTVDGVQQTQITYRYNAEWYVAIYHEGRLHETTSAQSTPILAVENSRLFIDDDNASVV